VQDPVKERVERLREEIAELTKEHQALRGRKDFIAFEKLTRSAERLEKILAELRSLTDWKKP
jgi:uncharacterized membrane protein (DUF106 family)